MSGFQLPELAGLIQTRMPSSLVVWNV